MRIVWGLGLSIAAVLWLGACRPARPEALYAPKQTKMPSDAEVAALGKRLITTEALILPEPALLPVAEYQPPVLEGLAAEDVSAPVPPPGPRATVPPRALMSAALARCERLRGLGKWRGAIKAFDEVLAAPPSDESTYARYRKAQCLLASGDRDGAREVLEYLAGTRSPERLAALYDLAQMYIDDGDVATVDSRLVMLAPGRVAELRPWLLAEVERAGDDTAAGAIALALAHSDHPNRCAYAWHAFRRDRHTTYAASAACVEIDKAIAKVEAREHMRGAREAAIERAQIEVEIAARAQTIGFDRDGWRRVFVDSRRSEVRAIALYNLAESELQALRTRGAVSYAEWADLADAYDRARYAILEMVLDDGTMPATRAAMESMVTDHQLAAWFNAARQARADGVYDAPTADRILDGVSHIRDRRAAAFQDVIETGHVPDGVQWPPAAP